MSGLKAHCMLCFYKTWNCWMWNCCILSSLHSLKPKSFISKKIYSLSLTWLVKSVCSSSCSRTQDLPGIPSWWKTEVMEQILWLLSRTCSSGNRGQEQTWWTRQQHSWERCWVDLQYWHLRLLLAEPPPPSLSIQILPEKRKLGAHTIWAALLTVEITWKPSIYLSGILPLYIFQKS